MNTPTQDIQHADHELETLGYHQELERSLTLWQLTAFGLNYMIPIAPAIIFGFVMVVSGGTVAIPYLLACIAMSFTAWSYAVLLRLFPVAGSLYSYVSRGLHPSIGFLAGWVLLLDYVLIPTVTAMSSAIYIRQLFPAISYEYILLIFTFGTGLFNVFGVKLMARLGLWLLLIGEIVIFVGFFVWSYAIAHRGIGVGHLFSLEPFHFHHLPALATATSLAVLSYLGFDAITTLAEEAINPKRDIPRAIALAVIIGGITMFLTGYLGMLVIPHWQQHIHDPSWIDATLFQVAKITGGTGFSLFYTAGFILAMAIFNVVATAAGSRLLFGMGRDNVIPRRFFAALNQRWKTPHWNIILIVAIEFVLGSVFQLDHLTALVNYGALLGFTLLNLSVIGFYFVKQRNNTKPPSYYLKYGLLPLIGAIIVGAIFISLEGIALLFGSIWLALGIIVLICRPTIVSNQL